MEETEYSAFIFFCTVATKLLWCVRTCSGEPCLEDGWVSS